MALKLRRGKPPHTPLELGAGAFIRLRTATAGEIDEEAAAVAEKLAGILGGLVDASVIAIIAPEFDLGDVADPAKVEALKQRFLLGGLILRCQDGWKGIYDEDNVALPDPDEGSIALLLNDPVICALCAGRIYARVHEEFAEGNASAASPSGGAAAVQTIATDAAETARPVPEA